MSFVRNAMLALAVAVAIPAAASAQGPGGFGGGQGQGQDGARRGGGMQMLMKDITLTADQQAQIDKIGTAAREEMRALGGQPGTPPDSATRAKRDELRKKQYADIRKVLTADQQKTFDANIAEMQKRMEEMRRN